MNTSTNLAGAMMGATMIDRAHTETALYRVAVAAFTYYPGKETDEPCYTVEEDLDWCTAPLTALPPAQLAELRERAREAITDPLADRRAFLAALAALNDH
jgi:hypothetical protein